MPTAKMSNAIYDTQAAFDPTICFTVYGSWIEAIEEVETASDRDSLAYQMFKAIANYSMYGEEPNFDNAPLRAWWRVTARGIDSSMGRRRKKFAPEEVTERERIVIDSKYLYIASTNTEQCCLREKTALSGQILAYGRRGTVLDRR